MPEEPICVCVDNKPVRCGCGAGGDRLGFSGDFNDTQTAGTERFEPFMIAEGRNGDSRLSGCVQNGHFRRNGDVLIIDRHSD